MAGKRIGYLQAAMMRDVEQAIADADVLLFLVDLKCPRMAPAVAAASRGKPVLVLLNKADLVKGHPSFNSFSPDRMAATYGTLRYHRGAIKFYKEVGLWKDK